MPLIRGSRFEAKIALAAVMLPLVSIRCRSQWVRCRTYRRMLAQFNIVHKLSATLLALNGHTFSDDYRHRSIDGHHDLLMLGAGNMLEHFFVSVAIELTECAPKNAWRTALVDVLGRVPVPQKLLFGVRIETARLTLKRWLPYNLMDVFQDCIVRFLRLLRHHHAAVVIMWNQMFSI